MLVSALSRVLKPFHYTYLWGFYVLKGTFVSSHQSQRRILPRSGLTTVKFSSGMETFTIASLGPQELWNYCRLGLDQIPPFFIFLVLISRRMCSGGSLAPEDGGFY